MKLLSRMKYMFALCFLLATLLPSTSLTSFAAAAPAATPELLYADDEVEMEKQRWMATIYECMDSYATVYSVLEAKATKAEAPELYKHARDIAARLDYARYQLEQSTTMDEINAMAALITDIMTQIMDLKVQIDEFEVAVSFTDTTVEGVEMTLKVNEENKTAEVIRLGNFEANSTVTIPESVNGYTVIGFGDVFSETAVGTVVLPQTIKSIVRYAFNGCRNLTSVNIPSLVPTIEFGAFQNCDNLGSIEIPSSVTEIGVDSFYGCSNLVSVNIPNSVTAIGAGAFHRCVKLKSIEIPNSVTAIKDDTFSYCYALRKVTLPNSIISIGEEAFFLCI